MSHIVDDEGEPASHEQHPPRCRDWASLAIGVVAAAMLTLQFAAGDAHHHAAGRLLQGGGMSSASSGGGGGGGGGGELLFYFVYFCVLYVPWQCWVVVLMLIACKGMYTSGDQLQH